MTPIRMLIAALAFLAITVPGATAATPPEAHAPAVPHFTWRSPGHPSERPSIPPADPVPPRSGASADNWTPVVFTAGVGLIAALGAGMVAPRRRPPDALA